MKLIITVTPWKSENKKKKKPNLMFQTIKTLTFSFSFFGTSENVKNFILNKHGKCTNAEQSTNLPTTPQAPQEATHYSSGHTQAVEGKPEMTESFWTPSPLNHCS